MTVDTVNTDIFDDNRITGILCVWFVGEKLERVRFDPGLLSTRREWVPKSRNLKRPRPSEPLIYTVIGNSTVP